MKIKHILLIAIILSGIFAHAQIGIPTPKKAKKKDDRIAINSEKDVKKFAKYLQKSGQPSTLIFGEHINVPRFFEQYAYVDELTQIVLKGDNHLDSEVLCKLNALNHLMLYVKSYDSALVNQLNNCPYITEVSYVFSREFPPTADWFKLKHVQTLNVLGIFAKQELEGIVPLTKNTKKLKHLRFSTDFTKDLPKNIATLNLPKIGFIDNLSFLQNHTFHDLSVEQYFINYWDEIGKQNVSIGLDYYSDRVTLEDYDKAYLSSIFYNAQIIPYYAKASYATTVATPTKTAKISGITQFSVYDTVDRNKQVPLFFKTNAFVVPFSEKMVNAQKEKNYEHFTIDPHRDNVLRTKKGYKILIPANCFRQENDGEISKLVDIYYRYIDNSADFVLSGIPGQYDSFQQHFALNNPQVAMLYASANNIPLKLKRGFAIDIELNATNGRGFMLSNDEAFWYPYDETQESGLVRYKLTPANDTFGYQQIVDFANINQRYYDPQYFYTLDEKETKVKIPKSLSKKYITKPEQMIYEPFASGMTINKGEFYLKPGKALVGIRKISFTDTLRRNNIYFAVYNKVSEKLFPELAFFKKYLFQYIGDEEKKTFTKALLRGNKFYDIRIFYAEGEDEGIVELKHDEGFIQLPFSVLKTGTKSGKEAKTKAQFYKKYLKYKTLLYRRFAAQRTHVDAYNIKSNQEKAALGGTQLLSLLELGTFSIATLDTNANYANINVVVNDMRGVPLDLEKWAVIYAKPAQVDYFNEKAIQVNFAKEFAMLVTTFDGTLYYMTATQCKSLKSGEGSVVTINARLVTEQYYDWQLLYKAFGFTKVK